VGRPSLPAQARATLHDLTGNRPLPAVGREHDACGIGFVADPLGRASRDVVDLLLAGLSGVLHRGATAADRKTGDGAGLLLPIPAALVPDASCGLAMAFLRDEAAREAIEAACAAEGIGTVGWRRVPVDHGALGEDARATAPLVEQLVLVPPRDVEGDALERLAYRARRRAENARGAYIASLSFRTVTYKALCAADQLASFYTDLDDPTLAASFGIFHQRFSTNTTPSWERAQPFRLLCHNGEINAIQGNVNWMRAREARLGSDQDALLAPVLDEAGSDSAMLDNALELLVRGGRDVRHALAMLVPEAWEGNEELDESLREFYRYHSALLEPWDGPAGIVFTDGHVVGAALDRNGLRPLRYAVVEDGLVVCSSEAGAVPLPDGARVRRGKLGPGQILAVDATGGGLQENRAIKQYLAVRRPYGTWNAAGLRQVSPGDPVEPPADDLTARQVAAGFTREELAVVLRPMAGHAHEPTSSMGDDTALAPLAGRARPLASYFKQRFAQVTNPPIDHLRERRVMSLRTLLGARAPLLSEVAEAAHVVELESFFLFPSSLAELPLSPLDATFDGAEGLETTCARLAVEAEEAVDRGVRLLLLTDEAAGPDRAAVPSLLAVGAVHQRLVAAGLRTRASIVLASDEPRETHHFACLLGFGADAICPRLALDTLAGLAASDRIGGDHPPPDEAQNRFRAAIEDGVLKVMSKMGISDLASYRGAQIFEAIALAREVVDLCFTGTSTPIGGVGFAELEAEALERTRAAFCDSPRLENPGYVKFRKGGEPHATNPEVVEALHEVGAAHALRKAVNGGGWKLYQRFAGLVNGRAPLEPRDLLELMPAGPPAALEEVEPAEAIVRRFSGGAMSHGALSAEAHELVAVALNRLGARANTGEGGEDPDRYRTERNSPIKQVASGRFGVTPEYAVFAEELQIKIAQGSKPGEGGQLPGHKVSEEIARLRHTQPGIALISPPPHHDIYSIEDLAQLIFDLRQVNPDAAVSVKLAAEAGVGLVAAGVVKALADVVHIAGCDGGTGASPLTSIKNAGAAWELGLAETQQALVANGLRGRARLRADGGLKTGRDVVVAALLGADEVSFGTALLLAEGCLMVRTCHMDTCPVGIATQQPELRAKFDATPEMVEAYLLFVAEEVRHLLAGLGLRSFEEAVGRVECLRQRTTGDARADLLDLAPLLVRAGTGPQAFAGEPMPEAGGWELGDELAADAGEALEDARLVELRYRIANTDRTVGARLGGRIGRRYGEKPPPGRVRAHFEGAAGQSFGAFLAAGVELVLTGEANDYVGKGMSGGRIVIRPPANDAGEPVLLGNTVLYGATGGELFCAGRAGERFAVRNSGAVAVVEGAGDHACEYMTNGTVVLLGEHGHNLGAGMTGGQVYVYDPEGLLAGRVNGQLVVAHLPEPAALVELRALVERHVRYTDSLLGHELLERWDEAAAGVRRVAPKEEVASLQSAYEGTLSGSAP
jgi:glutamate synthase domain-containing protein 2/glutamate synthase domain-containing protein 1/glutamate synthase domain-containing protein 3